MPATSVKATYNPLCRMEDFAGKRSPFHSYRVDGPKECLEQSGIEVIDSSLAGKEDILLAHRPEYVDRIENGEFTIFERCLAALGQIPVSENIYEIACASAGCGVEALDLVEEGTADMCFALTQPPGHHAGSSSARGFCVFNNAAIVAKKAKEKYGKVAIVDFDVHFGNGTAKCVQGDEDILFTSVHVLPQYPYSGFLSHGNCLVYVARAYPFFRPVEETYLKKLDLALETVRDFNPEVVIVSAGFDAYWHDLHMADLSSQAFGEIGKKIAELDKPTVSLLEGGYVLDRLPCFVVDYCDAFR